MIIIYSIFNGSAKNLFGNMSHSRIQERMARPRGMCTRPISKGIGRHFTAKRGRAKCILEAEVTQQIQATGAGTAAF
jgi:hypothetical protein